MVKSMSTFAAGATGEEMVMVEASVPSVAPTCTIGRLAAMLTSGNRRRIVMVAELAVARV